MSTERMLVESQVGDAIGDSISSIVSVTPLWGLCWQKVYILIGMLGVYNETSRQFQAMFVVDKTVILSQNMWNHWYCLFCIFFT